MWDNVIGRHIRRGTRNLFLWNGLLLAAVVGLGLFFGRYFYNFFLGPFPLDKNTLTELKSGNELFRYYVTTSNVPREPFEGWIEIRKKIDKNTNREISSTEMAKDLMVMVDGRTLIVRLPMSASDEGPWTGRVLTLSPDTRRHYQETMQKSMAKGLRLPGGVPEPLPVMIDGTSFRVGGWIGLAVGVPLGLLALWNLAKAAGRWSNPGKHPSAQALVKYGDPPEVAEKIDQEFQGERATVGPVTFTQSWWIQPTGTGVDVFHLGDSVWVYKTMTQHYTNGVPTGKTYGGVLCDKSGTARTVQLKENQTDQFVMAVAQRVPWVAIGYNEQLEALWKSNKDALVRLVEEHRRKMVEGEYEKPTEPPPADAQPAE